MIVEFIDANRQDFGVEPICTVLQIAPSTYYGAKSRPPSARAVRDAELKEVLLSLWQDNYCVYGVRKLHKAARRAGHQIGRDQTARLMRSLGIAGARRDKKVRTTRRDDSAYRHPDLVKRRFVAQRPNQLWVTDLTYVATWAGMVYVCFIVDVFSRAIVGWRVATNMRTEMVLDALEMARWSRARRCPAVSRHRIHDARHSTATFLLEAGVDIKVVAEILGHSQSWFTRDTYQHVSQRLQSEAAEQMASALWGSG